MYYKTMNSHFKKFEKYSKHWIGFFSLFNWEINCHHQNDDEDTENDLGYTSFVVDNRRADIFLTHEWYSTKPTDHELNKVAFHEVCEVFLLKLRTIANRRHGVSEGDVDGAVHEVIRTLENVIFDKNNKGGK